jgi:hypothetical protein
MTPMWHFRLTMLPFALVVLAVYELTGSRPATTAVGIVGVVAGLVVMSRAERAERAER